MSFSQLGLHPAVLKAVRSLKYPEPTPVQRRAIPIILEGGDLVAAAQTGTGKTGAFMLPILTQLASGPERLRALVLTPTRELAAQVAAAGKLYAKYLPLQVGVVYGGVPIGPQERMLRNEGVDVLVATPGRLLDLHGRQSVSLEDIEVLVLDEADRMVDMGFAPDLRRILRLLPRDRQTLMFSATMPKEVNAVAKEALRDPARIDLAPPTRPAVGITQAIYPVSRGLKLDLLDELLTGIERRSVIVFTRTKRGADRVARALQKRGHLTAALHGDRSQGQRERALLDLKRGRVEVLVATDIASRGIDVRGITHVINFDVPAAPEDYVHRIGRTGRVDALGDAFTLMSPEEKGDMAAIERAVGKTLPRITLEDFDYHKAPPPKEPREPRHAPRRDEAPPRRATVRRFGHHGDAPAPEPARTQPHGHSRGGPPAPPAAPPNGGRPSHPSPAHGGRGTQPAEPTHGRGPRRSSPTDRRGRGKW